MAKASCTCGLTPWVGIALPIAPVATVVLVVEFRQQRVAAIDRKEGLRIELVVSFGRRALA